MPRNLQRQSGLSTATGANQREEARVRDARDKMRQLMLTADETAERERKVVARRGFSVHCNPGLM
jgi:hypothetical protein